jgi:hypothetical protein
MRNTYNNFTSSFYNASGYAKTDVVMEEMSKLIVNQPKAVVLAIQNAGLNLPINSTPQSITETIMLNKESKRLIHNLSALILLSEKYNNFFKGKTGGVSAGSASAGSPSAGGGFAKKIGGFFKRGTNSDGTKSKSKFGNWFKTNKSSIGNVGGALAKGLFGGRKGGGNTSGGNTSGGNTSGGNEGGADVKPPMSMGVKIAIGGGVLILIIGVVLVMRKK